MYLKKPDVAKRLSVSIRTVENMMRKGILPFLKFGRVVRFEEREITNALSRYTTETRLKAAPETSIQSEQEETR